MDFLVSSKTVESDSGKGKESQKVTRRTKGRERRIGGEIIRCDFQDVVYDWIWEGKCLEGQGG